MPRKSKQEPERRVVNDFSKAVPMDDRTKAKLGEILINHILSNLKEK